MEILKHLKNVQRKQLQIIFSSLNYKYARVEKPVKV